MQFENPLNEWGWAFPVLGSIHLLGIVCALGAVALMNLRLLGVGAASSPARLWRETLPIALVGLAIAVTSGFLLLTIALQEYVKNPIFQMKMTALLMAIAFYFTAVRSTARRDRASALIGVVSLVLYALVPLGGILLGYD